MDTVKTQMSQLIINRMSTSFKPHQINIICGTRESRDRRKMAAGYFSLTDSLNYCLAVLNTDYCLGRGSLNAMKLRGNGLFCFV